jgi:hypothetical protein
MSEIFSLSDEQFVRLKPLLPTDTRGDGQGGVDVWSRSVGLRFCTAANVSFPPNQVVERTAGIVCTGSLADIIERIREVRFTPQSRHAGRRRLWQLGAKSGHARLLGSCAFL